MAGFRSTLNRQTGRFVRAVERRAFDSFLRRGRVPESHAKLAAAVREPSFVEFSQSSLVRKALGDPRPTRFYTWRTAGDERVRSTHAANDSLVFDWDDPPPTGHPGEDHKCRCTAEPYYGNPSVPDASLLLARDHRTGTTGRELRASIETLTRPDGSISASSIAIQDGTRIESRFSGSHVTHDVRIAGGGAVKLEKRNGVSTIAVDGGLPILASSWAGAGGPVVGLPRRRVAQVATPFDAIVPFDPMPAPSVLASTALGSAAALGLLALYNALRAEPDALGAGSGDIAAVAFKVWTNGKDKTASVVSLAALTAEEVAKHCKHLPDVQTWTNEAAVAALPMRPKGPAIWGTAVHKRVKDTVLRKRTEFPLVYGGLRPELSIDSEGQTSDDREVNYGQTGTTRLDILERVNSGLVCVYDIKTGTRGLSAGRVNILADRVNRMEPGAVFYVIEVRPAL